MPEIATGDTRLKALYYFNGMARSIKAERPLLESSFKRQHGITEISGAQLGAGMEAIEQKLGAKDIPHLNDPYAYSAYPLPGLVGRTAMNRALESWAYVLRACRGLIAFDMILCPHDPATIVNNDPRPRIATIRLSACESCGSCPEGCAFPGRTPEHRLPLLFPPPVHHSKVGAAQRLDNGGAPYPPFIARCEECLKDRWCAKCNVWWCEACYTTPKKRAHIADTSPSGTVLETGPLGHAVSGKETSLTPLVDHSIKVHNGLCTSKCLVDELLNGAGEGGMWG